MAGIGFRIEKILSGDTYLDVIKAHFYSAVIFSGPWLLSIFTIFALSYFSPSNIDSYEISFFRTSIVYVYAFSLVVAGVYHLALTRYLSDRLYVQEEEAIVPAFNSSLMVILVFQLIVGCIAMLFLETSFEIKFLLVMIYLTITALWVIMLFLTALRDYQSITKAFVVGSLVALGGSLLFGKIWGLSGYFFGYLVGHLIIVALLTVRIFVEFPSHRTFDLRVFEFLSKNKTLIIIGVFYNLAIWIDKMIFWISPKAVQIKGFLYAYPYYESAAFFAYLSIIPALSIFLIHIETDFYKKFKGYYAQILEKGTYSEIKKAKSRMMKSLRDSMSFVIAFQGIISIVAIIFSFPLAKMIKLQAIQVPVFRILVFGSFLHSLVLIFIIIILYFDFKGLAFCVTTIFLCATAIGTIITLNLPQSFTGYGYLFGAFIALFSSYYLFDNKIKKLEFITFASQPAGAHREEEIS